MQTNRLKAIEKAVAILRSVPCPLCLDGEDYFVIEQRDGRQTIRADENRGYGPDGTCIRCGTKARDELVLVFDATPLIKEDQCISSD